MWLDHPAATRGCTYESNICTRLWSLFKRVIFSLSEENLLARLSYPALCPATAAFLGD